MISGISQQMFIDNIQSVAIYTWDGLRKTLEAIVEFSREAFEEIQTFFKSLNIYEFSKSFEKLICCLNSDEYDVYPYQKFERFPSGRGGFNWLRTTRETNAQFLRQMLLTHMRGGNIQNLGGRARYSHTTSSICVRHSGTVPSSLEQCKLNNCPVNIAALEEKLRTGSFRPEVSRNMRPSDFTALCTRFPVQYRIINQLGNLIYEGEVDNIHEASEIFYQRKQEMVQANSDLHLKLEVVFPWERLAIGKWAIEWANSRILTFDPLSRFAPIIREAFRIRESIPGGIESSGDPYAYHPIDHTYYHERSTNTFTYLIYTLLGFQELERQETVELFYCLDDLSQSLNYNLAYKFATEVSCIYTYPNAGGRTDIRHKLQLGCGVCWEAWQLARDQGCTHDFLTKGPGILSENGRAYCFDARVMNLQDFIDQKSQELFNLDFAPKCNFGDAVDVKVARHVEAFRNIQIRDYVAAHRERHQETRLNYPSLKLMFINGGNDRERRYPRIGGVHHPVKVDGTRQSNFDLPINNIPEQFHQLGTVLSLKNIHDQLWYQVEIVGMDAQNIRMINHVSALEEEWYNREHFAEYLRVNDQPIREIALSESGNENVGRIIFDKRRNTIEASKRLIPGRLQEIGKVFAIRCIEDGQWYQAKVVGINAYYCRLDLSGKPIERRTWEAILDEQVLM